MTVPPSIPPKPPATPTSAPPQSDSAKLLQKLEAAVQSAKAQVQTQITRGGHTQVNIQVSDQSTNPAPLPLIINPETGLPAKGSPVTLQQLPATLTNAVTQPPQQITQSQLQTTLPAIFFPPLTEGSSNASAIPATLQTQLGQIQPQNLLNLQAIIAPDLNLSPPLGGSDSSKTLTAPNSDLIQPNPKGFFSKPQLITLQPEQLSSAATGKLPPVIEGRIDHYAPPSPKLTDTPLAPDNVQRNSSQITLKLEGFTEKSAPVFSVIDSFSGETSGASNFYSLTLPAGEDGAPDIREHLPAGTRLTVTPHRADIVNQQSFAQTPPPVLIGEPIPLPALGASEEWPLLNDIKNALNNTSPMAAQAFTSMVPNPAVASNTANIMPAVMFFVAAARGGDLSSWLGDKAIETLKNTGKGDLLSRLTGESQNLGRTASEPRAGEWRAIPIPMAGDQSDIQKIALYYHHDRDPEDQEENGKKPGTRFVFDMTLSAMGPVQIDGMFRYESTSAGDKPRLDLAVRTQTPFARAAQLAMTEIYTSALEDANAVGSLLFQNHPEAWVKINESPDAERYKAEI